MKQSRRGKLTLRKERGANTWRVLVDGAYAGSVYAWESAAYKYVVSKEVVIRSDSLPKMKTALRRYYRTA
jgi:hypothetical protein